MHYKLIFTDNADNDIENSMDWYENKQKGLGKKYLFSIKATVKSIVKNPFAFCRNIFTNKKSKYQKISIFSFLPY